jgi:glycosyltransferase involved in cell wall biosynthesis
MKVLILNHNLRGHGTYHRSWSVAHGLAARGWEVVYTTVSTTRRYRTSESLEDGVRVVETPNWTWPGLEADDGWGPLGVVRRLGLAMSEQFDWVYPFAHTPNCALPAKRAARRHGTRLAVDWCDDFSGGVFPQRRFARAAAQEQQPIKWAVQGWAEQREEKAEVDLLRRAEKVTVISPALLHKAIDYGLSPERVRLAPSGCELDFFRPRPMKECRRGMGLPLDAPLLTYIANYHPDEIFLFDALARVFAERPDARLAYTGPPFSDPRVSHPPFDEQLIPLGRVEWERLPEVVSAADVALVTMADTAHNRTRFPQKFLDCMATGRPVVSCLVGEVGEIYKRHPEIGRASTPEPEAFSEAILEVLGATEQERDALGRAGRALAEREYSWDRAVDLIDAFLRE